jgi:hypothetical protein
MYGFVTTTGIEVATLLFANDDVVRVSCRYIDVENSRVYVILMK